MDTIEFCRDFHIYSNNHKTSVYLRGEQGLEMCQRQRQKSFKESLKALEADIQHANTLGSSFTREYDGACIQMRLSYSPIAQLFLFLVQWADCSLASTLGLLYILIYKVYSDGTTTMSTYERKASLREFYGKLFSSFLNKGKKRRYNSCDLMGILSWAAVIYPSLLQLQGGITEMEDNKQKLICKERYKKRVDEERRHLSELDLEREKECGICMETQTKVVLPNCSHAMCLNCYREWHARSESCPFCRDSLKRVNSTDLWIFTSSEEVVDMETLGRENLKRLFNYIDKLPLIVPESLFYVYDSHYDSYMK